MLLQKMCQGFLFAERTRGGAHKVFLEKLEETSENKIRETLEGISGRTSEDTPEGYSGEFLEKTSAEVLKLPRKLLEKFILFLLNQQRHS